MNVQMKNPWQIGRAIFRQTTHPKLTARNEGKRGHDKARSHMRSANSTMGPQVPGFRSSAWHNPPVHVHNCGDIPAVVPASFADPAPWVASAGWNGRRLHIRTHFSVLSASTGCALSRELAGHRFCFVSCGSSASTVLCKRCMASRFSEWQCNKCRAKLEFCRKSGTCEVDCIADAWCAMLLPQCIHSVCSNGRLRPLSSRSCKPSSIFMANMSLRSSAVMLSESAWPSHDSR